MQVAIKRCSKEKLLCNITVLQLRWKSLKCTKLVCFHLLLIVKRCTGSEVVKRHSYELLWKLTPSQTFLNDFNNSCQIQICRTPFSGCFFEVFSHLIFAISYGKANISGSRKRLSPIITNQLGRKSYCAKKDCLLKQHSYFWKGMLFMREKVNVKVWERDRERETERQRERQRETERDRERQRETERQRDRERQRQRERQRDRERDRERFFKFFLNQLVNFIFYLSNIYKSLLCQSHSRLLLFF